MPRAATNPDHTPLAAGDTPSAPARPSPWTSDITIIALLALVQLVFFAGVLASDDLAYLACARLGPSAGGSVSPSVALRFIHWGIQAIALRVLPNQPWVVAVVPMLLMATTLLIIARLARREFGIQRPWIPMLLFGIAPTCTLMATTALPDLTATTIAWLGVALCCPCLLRAEQRRTTWRCLAGGLLIAMAYNAKETAAILAPSLMLFVALYQRRAAWAWRRATLIAMAAALWVGTETAVLYHWTGDLMYHSHTLAEGERAFRPAEVQHTLSGITAYASQYLTWLADPRADYGPTGPLLLAGLLVALYRFRNTRYGLLACLTLPAFLYLSLGSSSFRSYDPVGHHPRYLLIVLPALALAAGMAIDRLWSRLPTCRIPFALATAGVFVLSLVITNRISSEWYFIGTFQTGRSLIAENAPRISPAGLYASSLTATRFEVPADWLGGTRPEKIDRPPASALEWSAQYGGKYVLTTIVDRRPPRKAAHNLRTLFGPSAESLRQFPRIAYREPPTDRLSYLAARLLGRDCPTRHSDAVEIYYIAPINGPETLGMTAEAPGALPPVYR